MSDVISNFAEERLREAAKHARLRYVNDTIPGISRKRAGKGFCYVAPDKKRVTEKETLQRINSLAIPPAYNEVWICPLENGHLQATGFDARKRKQYRYHPKWAEIRAETKFDQMLKFAEMLPALRRRIARDMNLEGLPKDKVVASIVKLMDIAQIRIGNAQYAEENKTYGLTTMRKKHAEVKGNTIHFAFIGKSGKEWKRDITHKKIAQLVKQCEEIPGQELFKYIDAEGNRHPITSDDVNHYLKEVTGEAFTAKDFRTWAATAQAITLLSEIEPAETGTARKKQLNETIKRIAEIMGHTATICRKSYIHPKVIERYDSGKLRDWYAKMKERQDHKLVSAFLMLV